MKKPLGRVLMILGFVLLFVMWGLMAASMFLNDPIIHINNSAAGRTLLSSVSYGGVALVGIGALISGIQNGDGLDFLLFFAVIVSFVPTVLSALHIMIMSFDSDLLRLIFQGVGNAYLLAVAIKGFRANKLLGVIMLLVYAFFVIAPFVFLNLATKTFRMPIMTGAGIMYALYALGMLAAAVTCAADRRQ